MIRPTGLQCEIDALIASLGELRKREIVGDHPDEDLPTDLRALGLLLTATAIAIDPLIQRIAYEAGLGSMSGASPFAGLATDGVDDLLSQITARADSIEDERAGDRELADRREYGTLNHRQQGLSR